MSKAMRPVLDMVFGNVDFNPNPAALAVGEISVVSSEDPLTASVAGDTEFSIIQSFVDTNAKGNAFTRNRRSYKIHQGKVKSYSRQTYQPPDVQIIEIDLNPLVNAVPGLTYGLTIYRKDIASDQPYLVPAQFVEVIASSNALADLATALTAAIDNLSGINAATAGNIITVRGDDFSVLFDISNRSNLGPPVTINQTQNPNPGIGTVLGKYGLLELEKTYKGQGKTFTYGWAPAAFSGDQQLFADTSIQYDIYTIEHYTPQTERVGGSVEKLHRTMLALNTAAPNKALLDTLLEVTLGVPQWVNN